MMVLSKEYHVMISKDMLLKTILNQPKKFKSFVYEALGTKL